MTIPEPVEAWWEPRGVRRGGAGAGAEPLPSPEPGSHKPLAALSESLVPAEPGSGAKAFICKYSRTEHQPVRKLIRSPVMAQPRQPMALKYR